MITKRKVLVVGKDQFGYSTTLFKHCQYLKDFFEITYLGWDYQRPIIEMAGIKVKHVGRNGNKIKRTWRLVRAVKKELLVSDIAFGTYFLGMSMIRMLGITKRYVVYVDTLYVEQGGLRKLVSDTILRVEIAFYKEILAISRGVAKKIGLKNYRILPLGGECFKSKFETKDKLILIYVGTLGKRKIMESVIGFHRFLDESMNNNKYLYSIVGDSDTGERGEIESYIKKHKLERNVELLGFIPQHQLNTIYNKSNVGISFVPIIKEFDNQPPTKTYEYLVSGLPVIATATKSNKRIVTNKDGLLIDDTPQSFYEALVEMNKTIDKYDTTEIQQRNEHHKWQHVVRENLVPILS